MLCMIKTTTVTPNTQKMFQVYIVLFSGIVVFDLPKRHMGKNKAKTVFTYI
jgi:hypothetical protein